MSERNSDHDLETGAQSGNQGGGRPGATQPGARGQFIPPGGVKGHARYASLGVEEAGRAGARPSIRQ